MKELRLPYDEDALLSLEAGDEVLLSGRLYVGRDQVHKRLAEAIAKGDRLPFSFGGQGIYYMGPSPAPEGCVIGAAGPTTSARMDPYSPLLIERGLRLMVGKGPRSAEVKKACRKWHAVYLYAYGGCGALYSQCILSSRVVAFPELGPEALLELTVDSFPAFCMIDASGRHFEKALYIPFDACFSL